jgi:hypothetical protein
MNNDFIKFGVVEDIQDPLQNGRVRVRIFGIHTDNTGILPTEDLPWAQVGQSTDSAAVSGIGRSPRLLCGSWVSGFYLDPHKQKFVVLCSISGMPGTQGNTTTSTGLSGLGELIANIPSPLPPNSPSVAWIGSLTSSQVTPLIASIVATDTATTTDIVTAEINPTIYSALANAGVLSINTLPEKTAGIIACAHFIGISNTIEFVASGMQTIVNGNNSLFYYNIGYSSILGKSTIELPTLENLTLVASDRSNQFTDTRRYDIIPAPASGGVGFQDPSHTYPLISMLGETDINRLAKGTRTSDTIVGKKEGARIENISVANSSITWSQSPIPYNAAYPYNQVTQSEAGHIFEVDDTPGSERLNYHHSAGTWSEIDHLGNQTDRVKGTKTIIVEADELVNIIGSGHINVGGDISIKVIGACNIEVGGDANLRVHGNMNHQVDGVYNMSAQSVIFSTSTGVSLDGQIGSTGNGAVIDVVQPYTPTIATPAPTTRQNVAEQNAEFATTITNVLYSGAPVATTQQTDSSTFTKVQSDPVLSCPLTIITQDYSQPLISGYTLGSMTKNGQHPFPFGMKHGTSPYNISDAEIFCNMKQLLAQVVTRIQNATNLPKGFVITSGFREASSTINKSKGLSQHSLGCAIDINFTSINNRPDSRLQYYKVAQLLKNLVPFDQILLEVSPTANWIHISYNGANPSANRYQMLTLYCDKKVADSFVQL